MPTIPKGNRTTLAVKARSKYVEQKANAFKGMDRSNSKIYKSKQWQKVRQLVLHRQPLCVMCMDKNRYTTANTIDHIIPINKGGLIYSLDNLQALCSSCHNSKSARDRNR